jgi:spore coat polysaccharide biosynthesis protein SpsF (cytidylyltransferase family)
MTFRRELVSLCKRDGVEWYCGSLEDVLDRFYQAAVRFEPEHVIRLTGDCPLADLRHRCGGGKASPVKKTTIRATR